jgi:hypothetical protein
LAQNVDQLNEEREQMRHGHNAKINEFMEHADRHAQIEQRNIELEH